MRQRPFQSLARLGYAARGVVYVVVGGLAILAAQGGAPTPDSKGALVTVLTKPFGAVLIGAIALGLICFSAWRFVQAVFDADGLGTSARGLARRIGYAVGGVVNLGLAASAVRLGVGFAGAARGGDASAQDWTASLLALPAGQWLVGLLGIAVGGAGVGQAVKAWKATFEERLAADEQTRKWVRPMGRLGFAARAIVFLLIGLFLVLAALHANSREAHGLGGALKAIQAQPYGWILLTLTGLGLLAFGAFQFVMARYRVIAAPELKQVAAAAKRRF